MSKIRCSNCKAIFEGDQFGESPDFDHHECSGVAEEKFERWVDETRANNTNQEDK